MKTSRFLGSVFLMGVVVLSAAGATSQSDTLFRTNEGVGLSLITTPAQTSKQEANSVSNQKVIRLNYVWRGSSVQAPSWLQPLQPQTFSPSVEAAERLNAEAMRRYRENWRWYLKNPLARPVPVLYPSRLQQIHSEKAPPISPDPPNGPAPPRK